MADKFTKTPPAPSPADKADPKTKDKKKDEPRDSMREIWETIVFVVVLVLMLKTFVAEAFVIPTGSMAETLYGYQRMVVCDQCDYKFPVNCSREVDPQRGNARQEITGCFCPNCQNPIRWEPATAPSWSSGDRVLVAKFLYDRELLWSPKRHQIIVFKFPKEPQQGTTAMNYIKRCEAEPGETIVIFDGDLYVSKSVDYSLRKASEDPLDRWKPENMFVSDEKAVTHFVDSMQYRAEGRATESHFQIVRKSPEIMLAMRRIVFDNDHQPKELTNVGIRRWQFGSRWAGNDPKAPKVFTHTPKGPDEKPEWLAYGHILGMKEHKDRLDNLLKLERAQIENK